MRIGSFVVLMGLLGVVSAARADATASTYIAIEGAKLAPCLSSGQTNASCSSSGSDMYGVAASATASGDQFSGRVSAFATGHDPDVISGTPATGSAQVQIGGEYVLVGGTGTGSFDLNYYVDAIQGPYYDCSVKVFGGSAGSCNDPVIVEYGVPFTMDIELSMFAENGSVGESVLGDLSVDFSQPGLEAIPTPEPSSILLLMPGLAGVMFAARLRTSDRWARAVVEPHP